MNNVFFKLQVVGFYVENGTSERRQRALWCRVLDVPLALMAAGLAEGRTEEGERGGGEPDRQREEAPAAASDRHTDTLSTTERDETVRLLLLSSYREIVPLTAAGGSVCRLVS